MRASQTATNRKVPCRETHISGAEGLYSKPELQKIVAQYIERAMDHPKGKADHIRITIEQIKQKPIMIPALPVATIQSTSPSEGRHAVKKILSSLGISPVAIGRSLVLLAKGNMRGASLITSSNGARIEPDQQRGVRASRLGIDKKARNPLAISLARQGINTDTVKEALILASKVVSMPDIVAELCISDDPDYTTGYVASGRFGYLRIPHIKQKGSKSGGRAFFVKEGTRAEALIHYLEKVPVIVYKVSSCAGVKTLDEIVDCTYQ